jgi:hypothetical protein
LSTLVFGGYGTFGSIVSRELARLNIPVTIAGRDIARARDMAHALGSDHKAIEADANSYDSCRSAMQGKSIAVNCAGPYSAFNTGILEACIETGCNYIDISEERDYCSMVRGYSERFKERGITAVYGCSSLPAISGALGLSIHEKESALPEHVRVTLMIGNNNPKGSAAIRSAVRILGKSIIAPQGELKVFGNGEVVSLPKPFGKRMVFNFDSPEYDLFPELFGARKVTVKVGFELRSATLTFALLSALGSDYGDLTATFLERTATFFRGFGHSGGAIKTELFYRDATVRSATLYSDKNSQRMVSLPCVFAVEALHKGISDMKGTVTAYELLGAAEMIERIKAEGFFLTTENTERNSY